MVLNIKDINVEKYEFQMFVLDELADEAIENGKDVIKLTIGISELAGPAYLRDVINQGLLDLSITRQVYPEGLPSLRAAIADYYSQDCGVSFSPGNVIISTGTSTIMRNLLQLIGRPGQTIMLPRPYYCLYLLSAALVDLNVKFYDIDPFTGRLDFQSFVKNYSPTDTCAVIINSPGNPLGNVLQEQEIRAIYEYVNAQSFVVLDEIYNNTCFYENYLSPFSYLDPQLLKTTIITNGFSKAFRMYTKRVGFALLPPSLQMPMRIIQQHTLLTHDPVTQLAMEEALKDRDSPRELTAIYKERAQYAFETLNGTACAPIEPHGGFYIVLDCDNWNRNQNFSTSKELARDILERTSVAVVPGTDFGIPQCLRLSFCNDRFNEAIDRLRDYFSC